jgi:hypothetical protein
MATGKHHPSVELWLSENALRWEAAKAAYRAGSMTDDTWLWVWTQVPNAVIDEDFRIMLHRWHRNKNGAWE